ncbi:MAG: hypothetical protein AB1451_05310 [Nitrospirota bacterium]
MVDRLYWGWWMVVALVIAEGALREAGAVPAFTRKFDMDCSYCHSVPPALNDFGEAFRAHGYRMAGLEERLPEELRDQVRKEEPEDLPPSYWPLSARVVAGYGYTSQDHQDTDRGEAKIQTRTSGIERFDLMMGGLLTETVNFYVKYLPAVTNVALGPAEGQDGELESAWIRFNDLSPGGVPLNVKLGEFELDVPLSSARRLSLSDYPIYRYFPEGSSAADDPETTLDWSASQLGAEASGQAPWGLAYSLALINGTNGNADSNKAFDFYLRVAKPLNEHRVGLFTYLGTASTDFQFTPAGDPIEGTGLANQTFYRMGADGQWLAAPPLRLFALALYGSDSSGLFNGSDPQTATFIGGFLEARYDLLQDWSTMLVFRYDIIRNLDQGDATTDQKTGDLDGTTVAARYRMFETSRLALLFHGEYSHVKTKLTSVDGNDQTENRLTLAFDLML